MIFSFICRRTIYPPLGTLPALVGTEKTVPLPDGLLPDSSTGERSPLHPAGPLDGYSVDQQVGFLLRRAHQRHASIFLDGMAQVELTPTQFTALVKTVETGRITQNHLGRLAAMDPATIQGVVRRLVERGLLLRTQDPADRRTVVLEPTETGLALVRSAVASARGVTAATLAPLDPEERRQFLLLLRKMV
jgi:DNA-binding MarR family transcriptional regulator